MLMVFGDQLSAAVASDSSAGWANTLERNHSEISEVLSRYSIGRQQYASNHGLLEALGPAVDDELAASYAAQLLDERDDTSFYQPHAKVTFNTRSTAPSFDLDSIDAMVSSVGPAIYEPITM